VHVDLQGLEPATSLVARMLQSLSGAVHVARVAAVRRAQRHDDGLVLQEHLQEEAPREA